MRAPEACPFCMRSRDDLPCILSLDGASICTECIASAAALVEELVPALRTRGRIVAGMATSVAPADATRTLEPLVRAACVLLGDDAETVRWLAIELAQLERVAYARASVLAFRALGADKLTHNDAAWLRVAALNAGDFATALAARSELDDNDALAQMGALETALIAVEVGQAEVAELAARMDELARAIPTPIKRSNADTVHACRGLAEQRNGHPARAIACYEAIGPGPLRPWHELAFVDALNAVGRIGEADARLVELAARDGASEVWRERATRRLA